MPAEPLSFQREQKRMTDWLREPTQAPAPDVEQRRLDIYRELFFNNVREFVETAYPVLKQLLPAAEWDALVAGFFAGHRAQSPYFRDISLEFRHWMEATQHEWMTARPWVVELLHYEWVELAADCAETLADSPCSPEGDLLAGIPCLREAVWPLAYRWPVHTFSVHNPPATLPPAELTCLLVYRDAHDTVRQLEINPMTARLVELLQGRSRESGRELLRRLAAEAGYATPEQQESFIVAGAGLLQTLRDSGVVLGTRLEPA
ncbi:MAG: hypothetical protein K0S46_675 [Moraxellaceae bacterium]|jgi:hypothetical protein|nr:hypothetical protein [Moraxellaceae bacterium]